MTNDQLIVSIKLYLSGALFNVLNFEGHIKKIQKIEQRAIDIFKLGEFQSALFLFEHLPLSSYEQKFYTAHCHFELKNYKEALFYYQKALEFKNNDFESIVQIGSSLYQLERYTEALTYFKKIQNEHPAASYLCLFAALKLKGTIDLTGLYDGPLEQMDNPEINPVLLFSRYACYEFLDALLQSGIWVEYMNVTNKNGDSALSLIEASSCSQVRKQKFIALLMHYGTDPIFSTEEELIPLEQIEPFNKKCLTEEKKDELNKIPELKMEQVMNHQVLVLNGETLISDKILEKKQIKECQPIKILSLDNNISNKKIISWNVKKINDFIHCKNNSQEEIKAFIEPGPYGNTTLLILLKNATLSELKDYFTKIYRLKEQGVISLNECIELLMHVNDAGYSPCHQSLIPSKNQDPQALFLCYVDELINYWKEQEYSSETIHVLMKELLDKKTNKGFIPQCSEKMKACVLNLIFDNSEKQAEPCVNTQSLEEYIQSGDIENHRHFVQMMNDYKEQMEILLKNKDESGTSFFLAQLNKVADIKSQSLQYMMLSRLISSLSNLVGSAIRQSLWITSSLNGDTPLHILMRIGNIDHINLFFAELESFKRDSNLSTSAMKNYLLQKNNDGFIALDFVSLDEKNTSIELINRYLTSLKLCFENSKEKLKMEQDILVMVKDNIPLHQIINTIFNSQIQSKKTKINLSQVKESQFIKESEILLQKGIKLYSEKEYQQALKIFSKVLYTNEEFYLHHYLGMCYVYLRDYDNAFKIYDSIVSSNSDDKEHKAKQKNFIQALMSSIIENENTHIIAPYLSQIIHFGFSKKTPAYSCYEAQLILTEQVNHKNKKYILTAMRDNFSFFSDNMDVINLDDYCCLGELICYFDLSFSNLTKTWCTLWDKAHEISYIYCLINLMIQNPGSQFFLYYAQAAEKIMSNYLTNTKLNEDFSKYKVALERLTQLLIEAKKTKDLQTPEVENTVFTKIDMSKNTLFNTVKQTIKIQQDDKKFSSYLTKINDAIIDDNFSQVCKYSIKALEIKPDDFYATRVYGFALYSMNNVISAKEYLLKSLELVPQKKEGKAFTYFGLMRCAFHTGSYEECIDASIKSLVESSQKFPLEGLCYFYLGSSYYQMGSYNKALLYFTKFRDKEKDNNLSDSLFIQNLHFHIGRCYFQMGQFKSAINAFNLAKNENPFVVYYVANSYLKLDNKELATKFFGILNQYNGRNNHTLLMFLVTQGCSDILEHFFEDSNVENKLIDAQNSEGNTALMLLFQKRILKLEHCINLNEPTIEKMSSILLNNKVDVKIKNNEGNTFSDLLFQWGKMSTAEETKDETIENNLTF